MTQETVWKELCIKSFDNDTLATEFIQFILMAKQKEENNSYVWTTDRHDFQQLMHQLEFKQIDHTQFQLSSDSLQQLLQLKDQTRSYWHFRYRTQRKQAIAQSIDQTHPLVLHESERITLLRDFVRRHPDALFYSGLEHLLKSQLNQQTLVEWHMPDYLLIDTTYTEAYLELLIGILQLQIVYHDDHSNEHLPITVDYNTQMAQHASTSYNVRSNPDISDSFIQKILYTMPKNKKNISPEDYIITTIPRTWRPISRWKSWLLSLYHRFLSLFL